jgi:hypothetical protein
MPIRSPIPSLLTGSIRNSDIMRYVIGGPGSIMRASCLPLVVAFAAGSAFQTAAQTLQWPGDPAPTGAIGSLSTMTSEPITRPQAAPFGLGGQPPPCVLEFGKLRDEVQKKGAAPKSASEHKVTREQMCRSVQAYSAAEVKWLKFAEAGVSTCGIPGEVVSQLRQVHARTEQARTNICSAAVAVGALAAPSLSEALDTNRLPPNTKSTGPSTFDTLTGNIIQR